MNDAGRGRFRVHGKPYTVEQLDKRKIYNKKYLEQYRKTDEGKILTKAKTTEYYHQYREQILLKTKEYEKAHAEEIKARKKEYHQTEKYKTWNRERRQTEEYKKYQKEYDAKRNRSDEYKERKKAYNQAYWMAHKKQKCEASR